MNTSSPWLSLALVVIGCGGSNSTSEPTMQTQPNEGVPTANAEGCAEPPDPCEKGGACTGDEYCHHG